MRILNQENVSNDPWYYEWRTVGAYVFYLIVLFDFLTAPLLTILINAYFKTSTPWIPLTTQGGGVFYLAFGPILGISAWGKFSENKEILKFTQDQETQTNDNDNKQKDRQEKIDENKP